MFGIKFDAAETAAKHLRTAISELRQQRDVLQEQMDALKGQREALYLQALSKADAKQFLFDYIDAWGEQWLGLGQFEKLFQIMATPRRDEEFAKSNNITTPWLCLRDIEFVMRGELPDTSHVFNVKPLPVFGGALSSMNDSYIGAACFFFGDLLKGKLGEYFELHYPEPNRKAVGVSAAERRALIQELDGRIGELVSTIGQIDAKLSELGLREPMKFPAAKVVL